MHAASPVSRRATRLTLAVLIPAAVATLAYTIIDHERSNALWAILLAFAFAVVAFGRWRRLTALAGLATTFAILLLFVVSAILEGKPPLGCSSQASVCCCARSGRLC